MKGKDLQILIDYTNIVIGYNLTNIMDKYIQPKTSSDIGIIFTIPSSVFDKLNTLKDGKQKVNFVNSDEFIESIKEYCFIVYDKDRKICEIILHDNLNLKLFLPTIYLNFSSDVTLWVKSNDATILINEGFDDPHLCKSGPISENEKNTENGLCFLKQNINNKKVERGVVEDKLKYLKENLNKPTCKMNFKFSKDCVKYLSNICHVEPSLNYDGSLTQKEFAGCFKVEKILKEEKKIVYLLGLENSTIISGDEEGVEIIKGIYNFHSHPKEAYEKYKVKFGFPSTNDFIGFLSISIKYGAIFHIVVSLEGCYLISMSDYWSKNKSKLNRKVFSFIAKEYDYCGNSESIEWYMDKINSKKYQGYKLFDLQFIKWNEMKNTLSFSFSKTEENCFSDQDEYVNYLNVYKNIKYW